MSKEHCIIIHGCPGKPEMDPETRTYDKHWIPWTKRSLISHGILTEAPIMPEPWAPVYDQFKAEFEKLSVDEHTILVGHSCGCAFLVRWLGETKKKIAKLILVAPWKVSKPGDRQRDEFYGYAIDPTIKERVGEIILFTSDNESDPGKKSIQEYCSMLGGQVISLSGHGHYIFDHMGTEEFPELIAAILGQ